LTIDVDITYEVFGKIKNVHNNNLRTSSKSPLVVYRSKSSLPTLPGWIAGDTHTHSSYTDDQVEFGSPIQASVNLSKAMGLSFFCVTDHSYDLDDAIGNYLVNDPALPKWHQLQNDINESNSRQKDCVVVRGEEVSCENSDGRTVHLLLFGSRTFFHGSGDGAEKWFQTKCEHTIPYVLRSKEPGVAAYAGHPTEDVPLLQRLLLGRGEWSKQDISLPELNGIQILNGENSDAFRNGMDAWIWLLLRGEKKFIAAGNDAHGNFNRFVQVGIPFIAIREKKSQLFGKMKTAVFASVNENSIIAALGAGHSVITNGPLAVIEIETNRQSIGRIGDTVPGNSWIMKIHAISTEEFGRFVSVRIFAGTVGKHERVLHEWKDFSSGYELHTLTGWETDPAISYIRAEAFTTGGTGVDREGFCYTNPIWISPE
ncbi:MAG: CehA/McbA family metallohydrolase domain-containing protein, partial [Bacteroidota bacterium]